MTLAIAHREGDGAVLDLIREVRPPFSPESVVADFTAVLRQYRVHAVWGDKYAGEWPRERFRAHGITYRVCRQTRNDLYLALLPAITSGRVELLDNTRLISQLVALERRTGRSGRDSVDHPPRSHDDVANAVAGALVLAGAKSSRRPPRVYRGSPEMESYMSGMTSLWRSVSLPALAGWSGSR